jgi:hypothetical protein
VTFCWLSEFRDPTSPQVRLAEGELAWLAGLLAATPALQRGVIFTPSVTSDPYLDDGPPPLLAVQLYFDNIAALEEAAAPGGHLQGLAAPDALPSLRGADVTQQAMAVRHFAVP